MPIPATSISTVQVNVIGRIAAAGGNVIPTNFGFVFSRTSTVPPLVKSQIDTAFQAAIVVDIGAALNIRWLQQYNTVRYADDAQDAPVQFNHAVAGAVTGDSMPSFSTAYVLFRTGLRGKFYRGSKHFAPLSESDTTTGTDDILNAAAIARWATVRTDLLAGFTDASANVWRFVVLSKTLSQLIVNPTTVVTNVVTEALLNKRIGRMTRSQERLLRVTT
jgi:hypothetical protein